MKRLWLLPVCGVFLWLGGWGLGHSAGVDAERAEWTQTAKQCLDVARKAQRVGSTCIDVLAAHQHSENERCFCFSPGDGGSL